MTRCGLREAPALDTARFPAKACVVLLPVWGLAFIRQFLDFCLPSLLAPGNVPALTEALPTRFLILTRSSDMPLIATDPGWQKLARLCDAQMQNVDDLIVEGNHHAAVTLAYVRALRAEITRLRDTVFVFLVGDYLLADGSLRTVLGRVQRGASGVLAGSLQIPAEAALPLLPDQRAGPNELVLSPRALTEAALANLDSRIRASIVENNAVRDSDANRLFWSVDPHTLLGRFYLLHMIAIRPEVSDFAVGAPCDYAFIPELCPSGKVDVITDSDEYLAVELQCGAREPLASANVAPRQLARTLSQWTTAHHRENAAACIVFHAREVPKHIEQACLLASGFIDEVNKWLPQQPQPYRAHPSWIGMMELQQAAGGLPADCKAALDAGAARAGVKAGTTRLLWRLRLRVLGHPPQVTASHPRWPDFHALHATLTDLIGVDDHLLVLSPAAPAFARWLKPVCRHITASELALLPSSPVTPSVPEQTFDAVLWIKEVEQCDVPEAAFERIAKFLKPHGRLVIFEMGRLEAAPLHLGQIVANLNLQAQRSALCIEQARYVSTSRMRFALERALAAALHAPRTRARMFLPALVGGCALLTAAIFAGNQAFWRRPSRPRRMANCSSILVTWHRADEREVPITCQPPREAEHSLSPRPRRARGMLVHLANVAASVPVGYQAR
jgi:hypothetical protein